MPSIEDIREILSRHPRGDRTSTVHLHPDDLEKFQAREHDDSTDNLLHGLRVVSSRLVPLGIVYMTTEPEYMGRMVIPAPMPPQIEVLNTTNAPIAVSGFAGGTFMGGPFIPGKIVGIAGISNTTIMPERKNRWTLVDEEDLED